MTASALLRTARQRRGVSQRQLALAAGDSQPGIAAIESGAHDTTLSRIEHLLAPLGQRLTLLPTRSRPAWEAAASVAAALARSDLNSAWREIIQLSDDLVREPPAIRVALAVSPPLPVGDRRYDALLAGIVDHRLTEDGLPRPDWLDDPHFSLDQAWDVEVLPELRASARANTPGAIARHGVYLAAAELAST